MQCGVTPLSMSQVNAAPCIPLKHNTDHQEIIISKNLPLSHKSSSMIVIAPALCKIARV